ncbi:DUF1573 domain-containing protein [Parasediminibacterium sp. JCM 36343]|uniref:DUF1573 domain-containing protein n=1 Tax=Parasediminibacterium sp. JCM 36343 TaxID=3374279 RepID=UPI003978CC5D
MKNLTILFCALFLSTVINAQLTTTTTPGVIVQKDINKTLEFVNADYDFGKIPFGKPTEYVVKVKNISADSVTLDNVQAGCGCTTPHGYTKGEKIAPGQTVTVTLGFNGGTNGAFTKFVTFFFSGGLSKQVTFHGETFKPAEEAAPANGATQKMKNPTQSN